MKKVKIIITAAVILAVLALFVVVCVETAVGNANDNETTAGASAEETTEKSSAGDSTTENGGNSGDATTSLGGYVETEVVTFQEVTIEE